MALYRHTSGFVCEYASSPGAGYTLIPAQPTDTIANRIAWWRDVDLGDFTSAWHPSELASAEVPGRDTNAGSGINILPNDYSSFEWAGAMPPTYTSGMTVNRTAAATYHGQYGVRLTTTSAGGTVWLAASGSDFNIALAPSSKWIVSAYVRPLTDAAVSGALKILTNGSTTHSVAFTSGDDSAEWVRVSGVLDLSADTSDFGQVGISLTNNGTSLDIDALMLEEKIGPFDTASTFYSPWGNGLSDDEIPDGGISQDKLFGDLSDRIDLIDASSLVPGSVNARLASQYDTLVQQISEVSVGNGQFDSKIIWYFDASSEITGWTGTSASLSVASGYLTVTATGSNPKFKTATIAVDGSAYQSVRMRVQRTGGTGWTGTLRYYYSGGSDVVTISEPAQIDSEYVEVEWDMSAAALWTANTITAVEIQLGTASGDNYSIDWMGVGRNAPGASYSQVEAVRVLSDNKTRVFYQTAAPTSDANYTLKANDLWFDTDDGYKPYRWTGSAWAETTDTRLAESWSEILDIRNATASPSGAAAQRINSISATASSKNKTYYQASTSSPSSPTTGDLWFQTDQGNKAFRWSGSAWVETTDTRLPTAVSSISNIETAKIGYCTIGGNTSTHGDKSACEAAGGTWNVGLPWATAVKQVSITAGNGQSATVQQQFETIYGAGGLRAQYSVKLDVNGYVAGFGLYNEGAGASGFIVRADKFVVGSAGSNRTPFVVDGGVTYIDAAVIKDSTITAAKIATLNADKITAGTIGSQTISLNGVSSILKSSNYVAGSTGWQIRGDGYAEFRNVTIRGFLNASDLSGGTLDASVVNVANLNAGSITTGTLDCAQFNVTNLSASSINTGTLNCSQFNVTNLSASSINTGTLNASLVNVTNLNGSSITTGTLYADRIVAGSIDTPQIANNAVSYVTSGGISPTTVADRIGYVDIAVTGGVLSGQFFIQVNSELNEIAIVEVYLYIDGYLVDSRQIALQGVTNYEMSTTMALAGKRSVAAGTRRVEYQIYAWRSGTPTMQFSYQIMNYKK